MVAAHPYMAQPAFTAYPPAAHGIVFSASKPRARMWCLLTGIFFAMYAFFDFWSLSSLSLLRFVVSLFGGTSCYIGSRSLALDSLTGVRRYIFNLAASTALYSVLQLWGMYRVLQRSEEDGSEGPVLDEGSRGPFLVTTVMSVLLFLLATANAVRYAKAYLRDAMDTMAAQPLRAPNGQPVQQ